VFSAAAGLIGGAILALVLISDATGRAVCQEYDRQVRTLAALGLDIHQDGYQRGWFTSTAQSAIHIGGVSLNVIQRIHHAPPLLFGSELPHRPAIAVIDTEIIREPDVGRRTDEVQINPQIQTVVAFDGALYTSLSVPSFTHRDEDGTELEVQGVYADWYARRSSQYFFVKIPDSSITGLDSVTLVKNMKVRWHSHNDPRGILLGAMKITADRFDLKQSPHPDERRSHMYVRKFEFSAFNSITSDLIGVGGGMSAAESNLGSGNIHWELSRLNATSLQEVAKLLTPSPSDPIRHQSDMNSDLATLIYKIASKSPRLSVRLQLLSVEGNTGAALDLALADELAHHVDSPFADSGLPAGQFDPSIIQLILTRYMTGSGQLSVPVSVVRNLLGQAELEALLTSGEVTQQEKYISSKLDYRNAQLTLNGRLLSY
jgi:uncharacterized protein YdgA (DUF945 family)